MKPKAKTKKTKPSGRTAGSHAHSRVSKRRRGRLLFIECDPERLRSQGFVTGTTLPLVARLLGERFVEHIVATTQGDLDRGINDVRRRYSGFDIVVILGHSNRERLVMTREDRDEATKWGDVGGWLAQLRPRQLVLLACMAADREAGEALFETVPSLADIWGSPVRMSVEQSRLVEAFIWALHSGRGIVDDTILMAARLAMFRLGHGGLFFHLTPQDYSSPQAGFAHSILQRIGEHIHTEERRRLARKR